MRPLLSLTLSVLSLNDQADSSWSKWFPGFCASMTCSFIDVDLAMWQSTHALGIPRAFAYTERAQLLEPQPVKHKSSGKISNGLGKPAATFGHFKQYVCSSHIFHISKVSVVKSLTGYYVNLLKIPRGHQYVWVLSFPMEASADNCSEITLLKTLEWRLLRAGRKAALKEKNRRASVTFAKLPFFPIWLRELFSWCSEITVSHTLLGIICSEPEGLRGDVQGPLCRSGHWGPRITNLPTVVAAKSIRENRNSASYASFAVFKIHPFMYSFDHQLPIEQLWCGRHYQDTENTVVNKTDQSLPSHWG